MFLHVGENMTGANKMDKKNEEKDWSPYYKMTFLVSVRVVETFVS